MDDSLDDEGIRVKLRLGMVLALALLMTSCGGSAGSPRDGVHSHGGADAFNASLVTADIIADVTVEPAKVGDVIIHMEFAPPGGKLQQVDSVTGSLTPTDPELAVLTLAFEKSGANHFHYDVSVPSPGEWQLEFDAVLADGTTAQYATMVKFEG